MAPSMRALEKQYGEQVNFVVIDGSDPRNCEFASGFKIVQIILFLDKTFCVSSTNKKDGLVNRFQVDGIPHLAFLDRDAEVRPISFLLIMSF